MAQIQFIQTSPEELKNDINSLVKVQFEDFLKKYQPQQPKEYLSRNDVSKMLGVNLSTLFNWQKKKILIPVGISGRIYYLRSEIEAKLIRLND